MIENIQAEQAVLGAILYDGAVMKEIHLHPEHFANSHHQLLFEAMQTVEHAGHPLSLVSVTTELKSKIQEVGGVSYLTKLASSVATTRTVQYDQKLILEAYCNRKTKEAAAQYVKEPSVQALETMLEKIEQYKTVEDRTEEASTYETLIAIAQEMGESPCDQMTGFSTGYAKLDQMTGGTQRGDLIILAARPSMGKTAFALNIAANHCRQEGNVHLISLEMNKKSLLQRIISSEATINGQKWRTMKFSEEDYHYGMKAIGEIARWPLNIYEQSYTIHDIRTSLRQKIQAGSKSRDLVVIDYLQLITSKGRYERRDLEVGAITRELKKIARELNVPIIILSQLSRGVEQRKDKRPMMSDLRESGNIEQDADVIGFLYREDYYSQNESEDERVELLLSKQRNGPIGTIGMRFQKEFGIFVGV
ncbi:replicative DNA helicase [Halobacillus salinarum]|uniref:Replicative DNA helicase n=1 Tax=Halobacillus salinarum TaxID=2932257 RepID=A0ABY4EN49_9BACI|nr:replicative DNA helicase [Halobacillus salinarum]UOQ45410.1 replicative DNA helicase [Halobacillus salinarum]